MSRSKKSKFEIKISKQFFPSDELSNEQKDGLDFGKKVGKSIQYEWFGAENGKKCSFYSKSNEFNLRRLYANGNQPIGKYKAKLTASNDFSYLNMDWAILPVIPKFLEIIRNGINSRLFYPRAESQDAMSSEERNSTYKAIKDDMLAKQFLDTTMQEFGVNAYNMNPDELPEDDEELSLYMQMKFKPRIEIATETAVSNILKLNNYEEVRDTYEKDQLDIGVSAIKHRFIQGEGIVVESADPARMVWSDTNRKDFSDCFYFGEFSRIHYSELYKINPDITDDEMRKIRSCSASWNQYFPDDAVLHGDSMSDEMVPVIHFNYKTTRNYVHKAKKIKGGAERFIKKPDSFNPEENEDFRRVSTKKQVWYTGTMVLGCDEVIEWKLLENMIRPKSSNRKVLPEFIMYAANPYKGNFDCINARLMPLADQVQLSHLKLQQVQSRIVPDGVFIDVDGITGVNLGGAGKYEAQDALNLYFQTGSVVGRSSTMDGDYNHAKQPVQELSKNSGHSKISAIVMSYNHYLNQMRDVSGLNQGSDASTPDPNSLVGLQKIASLNSNKATKHILKSSLDITRRASEAVYLRCSDLMQHAPFAEEFANQIGKYNVDVIKDIKNMHLHSMGIYIEMSLDPIDKELLEAEITKALDKGQIDLEDAMDLKQINNLKLASETLKVKRRRRVKMIQEREDKQEQMRAQINMQSAQAAKESKLEQINAETESKIMIKKKEAEFNMETMKFEANLKMALMEKEYQFNTGIESMKASALQDREDKKEQAKDERVKKQGTVQSDLIEQKQKGLPAKRFESSEDSLDGLDFSEFNPR